MNPIRLLLLTSFPFVAFPTAEAAKLTKELPGETFLFLDSGFATTKIPLQSPYTPSRPLPSPSRPRTSTANPWDSTENQDGQAIRGDIGMHL